MKKYQEYKETGLDWLAEIPKHWKIQRNKNFLKEINNKNTDEGANLLRVSQYTGVTEKKSSISTQGSRSSESLFGYKCVEVNQLVINIMLAWNSSLGISKFKGVVSPAYCVFQIADSINPWFIHYLFRTPHLAKYFKSYSTGVIESRLRLYPEKLFSLFSVLPPKEEQDQIVKFLDYKISKINKFIKNKKKLIELLNEQKQAVINHAVTKGLNPHVEMKDSGIDWLGEVPKHWEVKKLKKAIELLNEKTKDSALAYIGMENIESWTGKYVPTTEITPEGVSNKFYSKCVLFGKLRPYLAKVYLTENEGICSAELLVLQAKNISEKYLKFLLLSAIFIDVVNSSTYGAKMPRANWTFIGNIDIPLPPKDEQEEISEYVQEKCISIDAILSKIQKEIDLIQEYKTSLISSVVTGQVDVRDVVVPNFTEEEFNDIDEVIEEAEEGEEYE